MKNSEFIKANRIMWNETADVHEQCYVNTLYKSIADPEYSTFDEVERKIFDKLQLAGKSVAQLCCNNGRELISVKKAGAGYCAGFDLSDKFIAQADRLSAAANAEVEFVCTDVYNIPAEYLSRFDIVYITIGAFGWLPDLDKFFGIITQLLKQDGQLFVYEMHPILNMYSPDKGTETLRSYFATEPSYEENEPDYLDPSKVVTAGSYWFQHKMSDIISACINHRLMITHFEEYGHDITAAYAAFESVKNKPPLCFSLLARHTG